MSNTSMPANFLNSTPLPSITGLAASGPMSPRPSTAVPLVMTRDEVAARGVAEGVGRVGDDLLAGRGDAGRIGERQVALVDQLLGRGDRDLAGRRKLVVLERGAAQLGAALF